MKITEINFRGYEPGQMDFAPVFNAAPEVERKQILSVITRIADAIIDPDNGQFTSIIIIGNSDRDDRPEMNCDQKRANETAYARSRASAAWEWVKEQVAAKVAKSGITAGVWWETARSITWDLVFAAAGMLECDQPTTEEQRRLNRRVTFLVSMIDQVTPGHGPVFNGRPPADFAGALPYASEIFGVYKPLAGWFGRSNTQRVASAIGAPNVNLLDNEAFFGDSARNLTNNALALVRYVVGAEAQGVLSPVGLINLFRQYFFEFDTFLGAPAGHLWISPGGTVEVVESSTRRTLVEKSAEVFEESPRKTEESLTTQEDIADAVKEDNANDTKLGASASGGANFVGIYHADASASFSAESSTKQSSEETHKHSRIQSSKVTSEIRRNFKTTFRTVTETTDTTSRRYVLQNTTSKLVNYELRRKMRKVGVQVQHIGANLSWQAFMDNPGKTLGLGELIHVVPAPDLTSIRKPDAPPPLVIKNTQFTGAFPIIKKPGTQDPPDRDKEFVHHSPPDADGITDHNNAIHIVARMDYTPPPPEQGYKLKEPPRFLSAAPGRVFVPNLIQLINDKTGFAVFPMFLNTGDLSPINLNFELTWDPPLTSDAHERYAAEKKLYDAEVAELQRTAYAQAVRDRVKAVSGIQTRRFEDLRREERHTVYSHLIRKLKLFNDPISAPNCCAKSSTSTKCCTSSRLTTGAPEISLRSARIPRAAIPSRNRRPLTKSGRTISPA
jgi:hypothetical protein